MSTEIREEKILEFLSPNSSTAIKDIAKKLYVSEPTARRYVNELARRGLVIRTHGGCMPSAAAFDGNTPMHLRFSSGSEEKRELAERAAALVPDHATLFLDSSSTAFFTVPYLAERKGLTVITSGVKTALALAEHGIKTMCIGGFIDPHNLSSNSAYAIEGVRRVNADFFFFSCDALSDDGELSDNSFEESLLRREFMARSRVRVLMLDSSKLGKKCRYTLGTLDDVEHFISPEN